MDQGLQARGRRELRILIAVDRGTLPGRLNPLAKDMVVASPDCEMTGEYTMASKANDQRRHTWR